MVFSASRAGGLRLPQIERQQSRPASFALDLGLHPTQQLRIPCRKHHRRAVVCEFQCNCFANAPARPSYNSDFIHQRLFISMTHLRPAKAKEFNLATW
jgi:hypothetical protein